MEFQLTRDERRGLNMRPTYYVEFPNMHRLNGATSSADTTKAPTDVRLVMFS